MAPKQQTVYFLSDSTVDKINDMIKKMRVEGVCERLGVSSKSLRSWLCRGQSISKTHRETIAKVFGKDAIVAEKY
jgi:uncharacterized protein YjcR